MNIAELFEKAAKDIEYAPHKMFRGVYLLHLVKGEMTEGRISSHLVKVDPFCVLDTHNHPTQVEIHEVIQGTGECFVADRQMSYTPGVVAAIPEGVPHKVIAGKDGLFFLVKFTPALL
jgi:quercetin dioxygenase-like cupin family protein